MGDTLKKNCMETSDQNNSFQLWDEAQLILRCSRTKTGKDNNKCNGGINSTKKSMN